MTKKDKALTISTISRKRAIESLFGRSIAFKSWHGMVHMMVEESYDRHIMVSVCGLFETKSYYISMNPQRIVKWSLSKERCKLCEKRLKELMR